MVSKKSGDLQGTHVGQTAPKVRAMFEEGWGKTLFVDEIGGICSPGALYSQDAVPEILTHLEDSKGRFVFVAADYEHNIESFLRLNDGLASRIPYRITVSPWGQRQATKALQNLMRNKYRMDLHHHHSLLETLFQSLTSLYTVGVDKSWVGFASGRTVEDIATLVFDAHIASKSAPGALVSEDVLRQVFAKTEGQLKVKVDIAKSESPQQAVHSSASFSFQASADKKEEEGREVDELLSEEKLKDYLAAIEQIDAMEQFQDRYNNTPGLEAQDKTDPKSDYNCKLAQLLSKLMMYLLVES